MKHANKKRWDWTRKRVNRLWVSFFPRSVESWRQMACRRRAERRVRGEEENDGLHCRRYALKLTCQTLKVCCALTHASLNITPPQCSAADLSLRFKPLCGALLAQEIIRCSISFCVDERREKKKVLRIVLYIFFNHAVFMRQSFIRLKKIIFLNGSPCGWWGRGCGGEVFLFTCVCIDFSA